jgi:hypothetical protein
MLLFSFNIHLIGGLIKSAHFTGGYSNNGLATISMVGKANETSGLFQHVRRDHEMTVFDRPKPLFCQRHADLLLPAVQTGIVRVNSIIADGDRLQHNPPDPCRITIAYRSRKMEKPLDSILPVQIAVA